MRETKTLSVSVDGAIAEQIEIHRAELREQNPGINITSSDAVRSLIKIGAAVNGNGKRKLSKR